MEFEKTRFATTRNEWNLGLTGSGSVTNRYDEIDDEDDDDDDDDDVLVVDLFRTHSTLRP